MQTFCSQVDVATIDGNDCFGKYGVPARANISFEDALHAENLYDVLIVPGGFECPDRLRIIPEVLELVRKHHSAEKLIAAICHGPWVLISSNILKGKKVTGFKAIKDDLVNAGAIYENSDVVIESNLITSPHYAQNPIFMEAIKAYLMKLL